jgi:hypothetical protein
MPAKGTAIIYDLDPTKSYTLSVAGAAGPATVTISGKARNVTTAFYSAFPTPALNVVHGGLESDELDKPKSNYPSVR